MVHYVHCCLRLIPRTSPLRQQSVFNRLSVQIFEMPKSRKKKTVKLPHLATASINMIGRGRDFVWSRRKRHRVHTHLILQILTIALPQVELNQWVPLKALTIPYNYGQPSTSMGVMSTESLRSPFQWSDDEEEASGYASSATVRSIQTRFVSTNMADINNDDLHLRLEAL